MKFKNIGFTTARIEFHKTDAQNEYNIKRNCYMGCECEAMLSKASAPSLQTAIDDTHCFNDSTKQGISGKGCNGRALQEGPEAWVYEIDANVFEA